MSAVGRPGGFANVGRGRYATRPRRSGRWVIANHLLVEKSQTRAQMLHQWDQRTCTDARQIGRVRAGSDRRLGKVRRCDPNRPPPIRQRDNDVGGTAPRPLLQHLKAVAEQKMMRVRDRDVRHDPFQNRGTMPCSVIPRPPMRFWIASSTTLTASSLRAKACENATPKPSPLTSSQNADPITASAGAGCSPSSEFGAHDRAKLLPTISEICTQAIQKAHENAIDARSAPRRHRALAGGRTSSDRAGYPRSSRRTLPRSSGRHSIPSCSACCDRSDAKQSRRSSRTWLRVRHRLVIPGLGPALRVMSTPRRPQPLRSCEQ